MMKIKFKKMKIMKIEKTMEIKMKITRKKMKIKTKKFKKTRIILKMNKKKFQLLFNQQILKINKQIMEMKGADKKIEKLN